MRWDGSTIVVLDEVRVPSPYTPHSVVGGSSSANERVQKVVSRAVSATVDNGISYPVNG